MKLIKLDRRYAGASKWKYALHFGTKTNTTTQRVKYANAFAKIYGPDSWINPNRKVFGPEPMWLNSKDWYHDYKRGRIYFNNEADVTIVELML